MSAHMLVVACGELQSQSIEGLLLRGDNESALQWISRFRGNEKPRSGAAMRISGVYGAAEVVGS